MNLFVACSEAKSDQSLTSLHSSLKVSWDMAVVIYKWQVLFLRAHGRHISLLLRKKG